MASTAIATQRRAMLDMMGEEEVFALYLEEGTVQKVVAKLFKPHKGGKVGRTDFYEWLNAGGEERKKRWQEVKKIRGDMHFEQAIEAAETTTEDNARSQKVKVDTHKWAAGLLNKEYSPHQGNVNVQVNVGSEWLSGMKTVESEAVEEAEYEVEDAGASSEKGEQDAG
jgi:2-methylcitrate dehydratase PrpD